MDQGPRIDNSMDRPFIRKTRGSRAPWDPPKRPYAPDDRRTGHTRAESRAWLDDNDDPGRGVD